MHNSNKKNSLSFYLFALDVLFMDLVAFSIHPSSQKRTTTPVFKISVSSSQIRASGGFGYFKSLGMYFDSTMTGDEKVPNLISASSKY